MRIHAKMVPGERPVLLLHGFGSDSRRTWVGAGWLRALEGRGVVLVDLREGCSPEDMAADVTEVLDTAGLSTVDVIAYSMGGLVGWELARRGRVRRLVLGGIDGRPVSTADIPEEIAGRGIDGEPVVPVLVVAGEADTIATRASAFASRIGAEFVPVPRRNHVTTVSSRVFKQAAIGFLADR